METQKENCDLTSGLKGLNVTDDNPNCATLVQRFDDKFNRRVYLINKPRGQTQLYPVAG